MWTVSTIYRQQSRHLLALMRRGGLARTALSATMITEADDRNKERKAGKENTKIQ